MGQVIRYVAVVLVMFLVGCNGSARHVAVKVDQGFAAAVFALDDLEFKACETKALSAELCAQTNPVINRALLEVRAVTAALQATPNTVAVPTSLPVLIADLATVQRILAAAGTSPTLATLAAQANTALGKAADLLKAFSGGK